MVHPGWWTVLVALFAAWLVAAVDRLPSLAEDELALLEGEDDFWDLDSAGGRDLETTATDELAMLEGEDDFGDLDSAGGRDLETSATSATSATSGGRKLTLNPKIIVNPTPGKCANSGWLSARSRCLAIGADLCKDKSLASGVLARTAEACSGGLVWTRTKCRISASSGSSAVPDGTVRDGFLMFRRGSPRCALISRFGTSLCCSTDRSRTMTVSATVSSGMSNAAIVAGFAKLQLQLGARATAEAAFATTSGGQVAGSGVVSSSKVVSRLALPGGWSRAVVALTTSSAATDLNNTMIVALLANVTGISSVEAAPCAGTGAVCSARSACSALPKGARCGAAWSTCSCAESAASADGCTDCFRPPKCLDAVTTAFPMVQSPRRGTLRLLTRAPDQGQRAPAPLDVTVQTQFGAALAEVASCSARDARSLSATRAPGDGRVTVTAEAYAEPGALALLDVAVGETQSSAAALLTAANKIATGDARDLRGAERSVGRVRASRRNAAPLAVEAEGAFAAACQGGNVGFGSGVLSAAAGSRNGVLSASVPLGAELDLPSDIALPVAGGNCSTLKLSSRLALTVNASARYDATAQLISPGVPLVAYVQSSAFADVLRTTLSASRNWPGELEARLRFASYADRSRKLPVELRLALAAPDRRERSCKAGWDVPGAPLRGAGKLSGKYLTRDGELRVAGGGNAVACSLAAPTGALLERELSTASSFLMRVMAINALGSVLEADVSKSGLGGAVPVPGVVHSARAARSPDAFELSVPLAMSAAEVSASGLLSTSGRDPELDRALVAGAVLQRVGFARGAPPARNVNDGQFEVMLEPGAGAKRVRLFSPSPLAASDLARGAAVRLAGQLLAPTEASSEIAPSYRLSWGSFSTNVSGVDASGWGQLVTPQLSLAQEPLLGPGQGTDKVSLVFRVPPQATSNQAVELAFEFIGSPNLPFLLQRFYNNPLVPASRSPSPSPSPSPAPRDGRRLLPEFEEAAPRRARSRSLAKAGAGTTKGAKCKASAKQRSVIGPELGRRRALGADLADYGRVTVTMHEEAGSDAGAVVMSVLRALGALNGTPGNANSLEYNVELALDVTPLSASEGDFLGDDARPRRRLARAGARGKAGKGKASTKADSVPGPNLRRLAAFQEEAAVLLAELAAIDGLGSSGAGVGGDSRALADACEAAPPSANAAMLFRKGMLGFWVSLYGNTVGLSADFSLEARDDEGLAVSSVAATGSARHYFEDVGHGRALSSSADGRSAARLLSASADNVNDGLFQLAEVPPAPGSPASRSPLVGAASKIPSSDLMFRNAAQVKRLVLVIEQNLTATDPSTGASYEMRSSGSLLLSGRSLLARRLRSLTAGCGRRALTSGGSGGGGGGGGSAGQDPSQATEMDSASSVGHGLFSSSVTMPDGPDGAAVTVAVSAYALLCDTDGGPDSGKACSGANFTWNGTTFPGGCVSVGDVQPYGLDSARSPTSAGASRAAWCPTAAGYSPEDRALQNKWGFCSCVAQLQKPSAAIVARAEAQVGVRTAARRRLASGGQLDAGANGAVGVGGSVAGGSGLTAAQGYSVQAFVVPTLSQLDAQVLSANTTAKGCLTAGCTPEAVAYTEAVLQLGDGGGGRRRRLVPASAGGALLGHPRLARSMPALARFLEDAAKLSSSSHIVGGGVELVRVDNTGGSTGDYAIGAISATLPLSGLAGANNSAHTRLASEAASLTLTTSEGAHDNNFGFVAASASLLAGGGASIVAALESARGFSATAERTISATRPQQRRGLDASPEKLQLRWSDDLGAPGTISATRGPDGALQFEAVNDPATTTKMRTLTFRVEATGGDSPPQSTETSITTEAPPQGGSLEPQDYVPLRSAISADGAVTLFFVVGSGLAANVTVVSADNTTRTVELRGPNASAPFMAQVEVSKDGELNNSTVELPPKQELLPDSPPLAARAFSELEELKKAIAQWCNNDGWTDPAYGPISQWDVSQLTSLEGVFRNIGPLERLLQITPFAPGAPTYDRFLAFEFNMSFTYLGSALLVPAKSLLVAVGSPKTCEGSWCYDDGWPAIYLNEEGETAYLGLLLRQGFWSPTLNWGECRDTNVPMTAGKDYALRVKITRPSHSGDVTLLVTINGVQTSCSTTYMYGNSAGTTGYYPWWPMNFILKDPNFPQASILMTALTANSHIQPTTAIFPPEPCPVNRIDISGWDTSRVTSLKYAFASTGFNADLARWDTSSVTVMSFAFAWNTAFNQPIGNWNTGNVENMASMFDTASAFNQPIGKWDTANVEDMGAMFAWATAFNQPIGNWNTAAVTSMSSMFQGASAFNQPLCWTRDEKTDITNLFSLTSCPGGDCWVSGTPASCSFEPPTVQPTAQPTAKPTTAQPTAKPTTAHPTAKPTTAQPTAQPTTAQPTTAQPTTGVSRPVHG